MCGTFDWVGQEVDIFFRWHNIEWDGNMITALQPLWVYNKGEHINKCFFNYYIIYYLFIVS